MKPGDPGQNSTAATTTRIRKPAARKLIVAAAILHPQSPARILAARRTYPPKSAGKWEFPGGKRELGETAAAALHRELREELNLTVTLGHLITPPGGRDWPITPRLLMRLWWARAATADIHLSDAHDEFRWLQRHELDAVPWLSADQQIIEQLKKRPFPSAKAKNSNRNRKCDDTH